MKLKLGREFIKIDCVRKVRRVGHRIAEIQFKTGEKVGVQVPDSAVLSYAGSVEDLIALIERLKD